MKAESRHSWQNAVLHVVGWFLLSLLSFGCANVEDRSKAKPMSKAEIMRIANKTAADMGYNLRKMKASMDEENTNWNWYISKLPSPRSAEFVNIESRLKGRKYWAVYYEPKPLQCGGDLFIFVDSQTGEVITTLAGQ
jgi:hypothetical protein